MGKVRQSKELYLSYIDKKYDYKISSEVYFFYFIHEEDLDDVIGEDWDLLPANGNCKPPNREYIKKVKIMDTSMIDLEVLSENDYHPYMDGVDRVIALAWENIENEVPKRLVLHFGDTLTQIEDRFFEKEIYFYEE